MLLTVDIGNTNITMGLFDENGRSRSTMRSSTRRDATSDEISLQVNHLARKVLGGADAIARTVLCSVVPSLTRTFSSFVKTELQHDAVVVTAEMELGIPVAVDDPREVGADRIVNALAGLGYIFTPTQARARLMRAGLRCTV